MCHLHHEVWACIILLHEGGGMPSSEYSETPVCSWDSFHLHQSVNGYSTDPILYSTRGERQVDSYATRSICIALCRSSLPWAFPWHWCRVYPSYKGVKDGLCSASLGLIDVCLTLQRVSIPFGALFSFHLSICSTLLASDPSQSLPYSQPIWPSTNSSVMC